MKVNDLLGQIEHCAEEYGSDFYDWDVYTEQIPEVDKKNKTRRGYASLTDGEEWEYYKCEGFCTKFPDKKIFTINVNY